jgi:GR25 family glycosyltransferase involved in LPS biosynthesis
MQLNKELNDSIVVDFNPRKHLETPVLFLIFNRIETTREVFKVIKAVKPSKLFIAGDGPRLARVEEAEKIKTLREFIVSSIDWDCEAKFLFHDKNYGCKNAVSKAISWFFENVDEGIILEDDVVPDPTFFDFCSEMLNTYRNNSQVMHIGGNNFHRDKFKRDASYYFSVYPHIWGWATWKRAWNNYDVNIKSFENFKKQRRIESILKNRKAQKYWLKKFEMVFNSHIDTWDYQWVYAIWNNSGLCITPSKNLSKNIGFGNEATHTNVVNPNIENQIAYSLNKIIHPTKVVVDTSADDYTFKKIFSPNFFIKLKIKIREILFNIKKKYHLGV